MADIFGNQEAKKDYGKPMLSLVPTEILEDVAKVLMFGLIKYTKDSWKKVEKERYKDACYRHWIAYLNDPHGNDEESGLPHLYHVATNIAFLCHLEKDNFKEEGSNEMSKMQQ